jgi:hypothetical protein
MIEAEDIDRALMNQGTGVPAPAAEDQNLQTLNSKVAEAIYTRIAAQSSDFWEAVYRPYSQKEISREVVLSVVEQARRKGATSMPKLARTLLVCDPDSEAAEDKKIFYRFKNFLYKTIRI